MEVNTYYKTICEHGIREYGFDTHARVLGITKEEAILYWNEATGCEFKRMPRTEYLMRYLPERSTKLKPYWELNLPGDYKYLIFYLTPTAPILIPHGFITDKGSIPLLFQNIVSNYDREMMMAFLVHDVECEMQRMSRFSTDGLIYEVGSVMGANWLKKNIIYTAVRAGNRYGKKDSIKNNFNVSAYNRTLIKEADEHFIKSGYKQEHLDFLSKCEPKHVNI